MMKKIFFIIPLSFYFVTITEAQNESNVPIERRSGWSNVGFNRNPVNEFPDPKIILELPPPASSPEENYQNILKILKEAEKIKELVEIRFKEGTYNFNKPIVINIGNLIFRGEGEKKTRLNFIPLSNNTGVYGIRLEGKLLKSHKKNIILDYCKKKRKIVFTEEVLNFKEGYYFDIRVQNGSWYNSSNAKDGKPEFFLGQIVKVLGGSKNGREFILEDDISLIWEMAILEDKEIQVDAFQPVTNVGLFNLKVEANIGSNGFGSNFIIRYATNCWVENIESVNPPQVHFDIDRSSSIVIKSCYLHHAQDYGKIPGAGYGIHIHSRSTNCLVENNIFYHLRHSIILSRSANNNVFGYNFSANQYSYPVSGLSDLNIHGFYPFGNLFEGNIVERIHADSYWGSNGPFNTFLRNYITDGYFKIEMADYSNSILNTSLPQISKSKFVLVQDSDKTQDISYYLKHKPEFLKNYDWPPISRDYLKKLEDNLELIPAQSRLNNEMK